MHVNRNLINGEKPQFGNPAHIAYLKEKSAMLNGEINVCEADWQFVQYSGKTNETRKPITYHSEPCTANALQCYIHCPRCGRRNKHVVCYDPTNIDQTCEFAKIDETEIACWNCGLEMYVDDDGSRAVYVKQPIE